MCGRSLWSLFSATSYILVLLFWRHIYDGVVSPNPFKRFAIFVRQNIIWVTRKSCFHGVKKNTTFVYLLIWNFRSTNKFPDSILCISWLLWRNWRSEFLIYQLIKFLVTRSSYFYMEKNELHHTTSQFCTKMH